ncbi:alpha/beta hydrolase family protein [Mesonia maritima]|uniref:Serine aminopeptidase S33 domain-containing protein n=1 Tax=Mesonia maritima TaxID=1793873 RepID=A0ABU1K6B9_9FLAO|nr:alpha/beta hydrolase [Mesonia maritima]MDR6301160.1 hypothetical protein [Mesonia maritima]
MRTTFLIIITFVFSSLLNAQENFIANDLRVNKFVEGTLLKPKNTENPPLVIFINESGPTNRDGNQLLTKNNSIKKLAEALAENNIASFRYDKRTLKISELNIKERELRFDQFIDDAKSVIDYFKKKNSFAEIIIAGHEQGSLIGMIAAKGNVDKFISIAGAANPIDEQLLAQIKLQAPGLYNDAEKAFSDLKKHGRTRNYNNALRSIFRPDAQAFMASWMNYNPSEEIKKLNIPILLIHGSEDLQVNPEAIKELEKASPSAKGNLIKNMNHVFRIIEENDDLTNQKTYNQPNLPIAEELVSAITSFIKS